MFRVRRVCIDTQSEHVVFIHERAVLDGALGFKPLDRVRVFGADPQQQGDDPGPTAGRQPGLRVFGADPQQQGDDPGPTAGRQPGVRVFGADPQQQGRREITGVLNFCRDLLIDRDEIGLSEVAFQDLALPEGAAVDASLARPPASVDRVRNKLRGARLARVDFDAILRDVVARRYSKPELSMFVLACALRNLDDEELVDFTRAMIDTGDRLHFDAPIVADKHCIGGIPGNRTSMILVPVLVACGLVVPKTSSQAITSAAGTADTMATLAKVDLSAAEIHRVVEKTGGCIVWGGALDLAPADDVLITVERPMEIDTEAQMIASILAKKKTSGATHALIDVPVGPSAKVRSLHEAERLAAQFLRVAAALELDVDVVTTDARAPIGAGVGPRLEALDVLAVLRREPGAPVDLREKSLFLAGRLLERTGRAPVALGYRTAQQALDSGRAERAFESMLDAQGRRELPAAAPFRETLLAREDGRLRAIDCLEVGRVAKLAGSPAHPAAGVRVLRGVGEVVRRGDPLLEIHAQSRAQLGFAHDYAGKPELAIFQFGY